MYVLLRLCSASDKSQKWLVIVTNITERYMSMQIDVRLGGFVCTMKSRFTNTEH